MPSKIFRTASSSAVPLKDGKLLEVRRGDLRGAQITDKRTWASEAEWLADIGESLYDEPELTDDQKLVNCLYYSNTYYSPIGRLFRDGRAKRTLRRLKHNLQLKKTDKIYLLDLKPNSTNNYSIPRDRYCRLSRHRHYYKTCGQYSETEYKIMLELCNEEITQLEVEIVDVSNKVDAERISPHYYVGKKGSYFVETDDSIIRPVYFYPQKALIGLISDDHPGIKTGRSFEELGVNVVRWWHLNGNMRILEFSEDSEDSDDNN